MLPTIAALLSLGIIAPPPVSPLPPPLPGIARVSVHAPARERHALVIDGLSASGVLLVDAASGQEIFSVDPDAPRSIGSLTKLMTALVLVERHAPHDLVTIPALAEGVGGSTLGLRMGQRFFLDALLRGLLIPSANDVAYALAAYDSHSVGAFVQRMNERAVSLGLRSTHFANPAGFDNDAQYSSPRDLAWLALAALRQPLIKEIVRTRSTRIVSLEGDEWMLRNTNELLQYNEDVFGVKTGTTDRAGECLIVLFQERERLYLLVLLGSRDRYADALRVLQALHDYRSS